MADAEDLKSSGDFSSCGFDSHPGHHSFRLKMNQLMRRGLALLKTEIPARNRFWSMQEREGLGNTRRGCSGVVKNGVFDVG